MAITFHGNDYFKETWSKGTLKSFDRNELWRELFLAAAAVGTIGFGAAVMAIKAANPESVKADLPGASAPKPVEPSILDQPIFPSRPR